MEAGFYIQAKQHLISIIDPEQVRIQAYVNQNDARKLFLNQPVLVENFILDYPNSIFPGRIIFIAPEMEQGMLKILVQSDSTMQLKMKTSIKIEIPIQSKQSNFLVPIEAVRFEGEDTFVFTFENGAIKKRKVRIGKNNYFEVEIISGEKISGESKIVVSKFQDIYDGFRLSTNIELTEAVSKKP